MLSQGVSRPGRQRTLSLAGTTMVHATLYLVAGAAIEVAVRILSDPYLSDNRTDAFVYALGGIAVAVAAGIPAGAVAGFVFVRRWGTIAASIWPLATVAAAWPLSWLLKPVLGTPVGAWAGLLAAAAAGALLVAGLSALTPADDLPGRPRERGRWRVPALAALVPVFVLGWFGGHTALDRRSPPARAPSLLLVTVDTLRADALGSFREGKILPPGAERAAATRLDDLAAGSYVFTEASTPIPKTPQAIASLLTGNYPASHGLTTLFSVLDFSNVTLAEILRERGWRTGAVVTNLLVGRNSGCAQGFDRFHDKDGLRPHVKRLALADLALRLAQGPARKVLDRFQGLQIGKEHATETTDRALVALRGLVGKPYFLWVHYLDPHWTYWPPEPYRTAVDTMPGEPFTLYEDVRAGRVAIGELIHRNTMRPEEVERVNALYAGEASYNGDEIGRLIDAALEAPGGDSTIIVLTSDHGESLGEHGYFFSHGDLVDEPGMRVPLTIRPAGGADGHRIRTPVSLVDVFPTVLEMMGIGIPAGIQGVSVTRLMIGDVPGPEEERAIFGESDLSHLKEDPYLTIPGEAGKIRSIRIGPWKLVRIPHDHEKARQIDPDLGEGRSSHKNVLGFREATRLQPSRPDEIALYNLDTDPGELTDLSAAEPERTASMLEILDRWLASTVRPTVPSRAESEELLEGLSSLGYVDRGEGGP